MIGNNNQWLHMVILEGKLLRYFDWVVIPWCSQNTRKTHACIFISNFPRNEFQHCSTFLQGFPLQLEPFVQRCSVKKAFLKILQKSKGNTCAGVSWIKLQALRPATLLKSDSTIGAFCEFCEIFKKTYFVEYLWTAPSVQMQNFRTIKI